MAKTKAITLEEQKQIMINMLEKLICFLDSNKLNYTLAFGTLIGAVRHKGFIPWDDDLDITMPYEDYHRMIDILKTTKIAQNIEFSCHANNPDHLWAFGKVYDTSTKLDEMIFIKKYTKRQDSLKFGLYIDIFPTYYAPDSPDERALFENRIQKNYKKLIRASRKVVFPKSIKNYIKTLMYNVAFIPYRIIGIDHYLNEHDCLIDSYFKKNTGSVCNNISINHYSFFDKGVYKKTILAPFENIEAKIPENYDLVLKSMYGDYMSLPPAEDRKTHVRHVVYR